MLGLGAGTLPRQYAHFLGETYRLRMTGVELDPAVVELGRRHLDLGYSEQRGLTVHVGDARTFLRGTREVYDVVVVDAFAQDVFVPFHLTTREFFELVKGRLAPGGVLGMNVVFRSVPSLLVDRLEATLEHVFGEAWRLRTPSLHTWQ